MKQINQHSASFLIIGLSVLLITAYILREKGFENGERTTFDEDLYAYMAYEMTVDIRHYNAINFSSLIRQHSPNRFLPDYLWKKLFKHPPFYSYLIVLSYKLHKELGYPITDQPQARHQAVRVSNCMGVLGILIIFLLGFYIFDWRVGVLAALFLAIDPVHWICSQKIWMETTLMTVMMASGLFYIMSYKYEKRKILFLILSGCCAGTAVLTKYPGGLSLIILFIYTAFTRPERFKTPLWYILPITAFIVTLDWILWNIDVYGMDFIFSGGMGYDEIKRASNVLIKMTPLLLLLVASIFFLWKKRSLCATVLARFTLPSVMRKKIVWVLLLTVAIVLTIGKEWSVIIPALSLLHEPETSWKMGFFGGEPWFFYLKKLAEYFPLYIFGYIAPFMIRWRDREHVFLPLMYATVYLLFFIFWRNFQSRYILPAIPWLLLLASYMIFKFHDRICSICSSQKRKIFLVLFWCMVSYGIVKAIQIDALLAWTNKPCYF